MEKLGKERLRKTQPTESWTVKESNRFQRRWDNFETKRKKKHSYKWSKVKEKYDRLKTRQWQHTKTAHFPPLFLFSWYWKSYHWKESSFLESPILTPCGEKMDDEVRTAIVFELICSIQQNVYTIQECFSFLNFGKEGRKVKDIRELLLAGLLIWCLQKEIVGSIILWASCQIFESSDWK